MTQEIKIVKQSIMKTVIKNNVKNENCKIIKNENCNQK